MAENNTENSHLHCGNDSSCQLDRCDESWHDAAFVLSNCGEIVLFLKLPEVCLCPANNKAI